MKKKILWIFFLLKIKKKKLWKTIATIIKTSKNLGHETEKISTNDDKYHGVYSILA